MNELESQTLKSNGKAQKKPKTKNLFSYSPSYRFECGNCNNKILEEVMLDFVQFMPDNKLTCPICMSLEIREVEA